MQINHPFLSLTHNEGDISLRRSIFRAFRAFYKSFFLLKNKPNDKIGGYLIRDLIFDNLLYEDYIEVVHFIKMCGLSTIQDHITRRVVIFLIVFNIANYRLIPILQQSVTTLSQKLDSQASPRSSQIHATSTTRQLREISSWISTCATCSFILSMMLDLNISTQFLSNLLWKETEIWILLSSKQLWHKDTLLWEFSSMNFLILLTIC